MSILYVDSQGPAAYLNQTDPDFIKKAIELKSCNALLLKVNQIGTLTESIQAAKDAFGAGWGMYLIIPTFYIILATSTLKNCGIELY